MPTKDEETLRKEMIRIYSDYIRNPDSSHVKKQARDVHTKYGNMAPRLDKYMRHALNLLVDIGYDLPAPPKPPKDAMKELVFALAARRA